MANLAMQGVRKRFGAVEILHGIDLQVRNGEFCVFVGPSGSSRFPLNLPQIPQRKPAHAEPSLHQIR